MTDGREGGRRGVPLAPYGRANRAACIQGFGAVEWPAWRKIPDGKIARGGHGFCRSRPPLKIQVLEHVKIEKVEQLF